MSAILNSLNAHNFPIIQPILIKLVSESIVYRALSYKTYLQLGLRSPLRRCLSRPKGYDNFFMVNSPDQDK